MMLRLSVVLLFILAFGCSLEEHKQGTAISPSPQTAEAPSSSLPPGAGEGTVVQVLPPEAFRGTVLFAVIQKTELQSNIITWTINGSPVPDAQGAQFKADDAKKGDTIQAVIRTAGGTYQSNAVTILNSPPEIKTLKLLPEIFRAGDTWSVEVATDDRDGDAVTVAYEWMKNGVVVGREARMPETVKRGDTISVRLVPHDGTIEGPPIIHDRTIANMPPTIQEHFDSAFNGTTYSYQVRASDVDGDALTYSLENPAEGMSIDRSSGLLTWSVPANGPKSQAARIIVDDGNGGTARYSLNISIR